MELGSLRLRLVAAWAVFILVTLQLAAVGLTVIFERSIMRRSVAELELDLREIAGGLRIDHNGTLLLTGRPTDPHYNAPYSGRYWQVSKNGQGVLRSPSLWDFTIANSSHAGADASGLVRLEGPDRQRLIGVVRTVEVADGLRQTPLQILTAIIYSEIVDETQKFTADLLLGLAALATVLMLAAWAHVSIGLRPLKAVSGKVAAIRSGAAQRLAGNFPSEVMPLVAETNALLDAQEETLAAARARAADLAHGLKTPLAVLGTQSRQLRRRREDAVADQIDQQIARMRGHIERELVRARGAVNSRHARSDASVAIRSMIGAMQLLPRGREISWEIDVATRLLVAVDSADLNDIMGNLVDNAMKWARGRLRITGRRNGGNVVISLDDDGVGIPAEEIPRVLKRGERADEQVPGTGLGLAIANDLVHLYGGELDFSRGEMGGLCARIALPAAA